MLLVNPLPENKISDQSKLKAFADDKLNVTQNIKVVFHRTENMVGKEENDGYQQFLLFSECFQTGFFPSASKAPLCGNELTNSFTEIPCVVYRTSCIFPLTAFLY